MADAEPSRIGVPDLSDKDAALLERVLDGESIRAAARALDVPERTAYRRFGSSGTLAEPLAELTAARAVENWAALSNPEKVQQARAAIEDEIVNGKGQVRLNAALRWLEMAADAGEQRDIVKRVGQIWDLLQDAPRRAA